VPLPHDHGARLFVRVWLEDDDTFRARLTSLGAEEVPRPVEHVASAASPGDVLDAVHAWLDALLQKTDRRNGG
jgi:hypothetical protein